MAAVDRLQAFSHTRTESAGDGAAITTDGDLEYVTVGIKSKTGAATADVTLRSGRTLSNFDFSVGYNPIEVTSIANLSLGGDTLWALFPYLP